MKKKFGHQDSSMKKIIAMIPARFGSKRVPKKNLVGEMNRVWYVGAALLDFERSGVDRPARAKRVLEDLISFSKERLILTSRSISTIAVCSDNVKA